MAISVFSAAKYLAERSDWSLTNLQIQKILYLAQMAYMADNDGEPLINDYFEAWDYGPVCPDLYHKLKIYGANPVGDIFGGHKMPEKDSLEEQWLEAAYDEFGGLPGGKLVEMTHQTNGAWAKHYRPNERGVIIPDEDIMQEYKDVFS